MMNRFKLFLLVLSATTGIALAQDPVEQDNKLGEQGDQMVQEQMGIYHHTITQNYIEQLGQKIAMQAGEDIPFKFSFQLVNMIEPNAFSLPGGYIYVSRGILPILNSEDELATILGHEIAHVVRRHSARQMNKSIVPTILTIPGLLIGGLISQELGNIINAPINAVGQVYLASYSRGQENEADEIGVLLAAKAGYKPKSLGKALGQLDKVVELYTGEESKSSIFDDHPYTPERVKNIQELTEKIHPKPSNPIAKTTSEFNHYMYGLHLQDDPEQGVFDGQKFVHPALKFKITFPEKWKTTNTPTAVGAVSEKQDATVVLGVLAEGEKHVEAGKNFLEKSSKAKGVNIISSGEITFQGLKAFEVKFTQGEKNPSKGHLIWFTYKDLTFQISGIWKGTNREIVDGSINTFGGVSNEELKDLKVLTLSLKKAKKGETLDDFSKRTGNVWKNEFLIVMNDLQDQKTLKEGQELKIAIWSPINY
jgi:predicted Zn-dependent protease